jgi:hypothetical protein
LASAVDYLYVNVNVATPFALPGLMAADLW